MRRILPALIVDLALVVVFCVIGRHSHDEAVLSGLLRTVWPFACGLGLGWIAAYVVAGGKPSGTALRPTGLAAWLGALAGGMLLRVIGGQGTAFTFILVAATVLAVFLLGWRACYRLSARRTAKAR